MNKRKLMCIGILSLYIFFLIFQYNFLHYNTVLSFYNLAGIFISVGVSYLIFYILDHIKVNDNKKNKPKKMSNKLFYLVVFLYISFILLTYLIAYRPGLIYGDGYEQLMMVTIGEYFNWFPPISTILMYFIPGLFTSNITVIIAIHIILFALSLAFLLTKMRKNGASTIIIVLILAVVTFNINFIFVHLSNYRDTLFDTLIILLFACFIDVIKEQKIVRFRDFFIVSTLIIILNEYKYNMLFMSIVLFIMLLKKYPLKYFLIVPITFLLVYFGGYYALDEDMIHNSRPIMESSMAFVQSWFQTYIDNDENVPPELDYEIKQISTPKALSYLNKYNSEEVYVPDTIEIKHAIYDNWDYINDMSRFKILKLTLKAFGYSPKSVIRTFLFKTYPLTTLTGFNCFYYLNYETEIVEDYYKKVMDYEDDEDIPKIGDNFITRWFDRLYYFVSNNKFIKCFFDMGIINLILVILFAYLLYKKEYLKMMLALSLLLFNFPTMISACVNEYRYYSFNYILIWLVIWISFKKFNQSKKEC